MPTVLTIDDSMCSAAVGVVHAACSSKVEFRRGGPALRCEIKVKVLTEPLAIARLLVRTSSHPELLGATPLESARVEEMLAVFQSIVLSGDVDGGTLLRLNDILQSTTCHTGNNDTVADVMIFHAVRATVVAIVKGHCDQLCHLVRWFDYIQYLPYVPAVPVHIRASGIFDILAVTPEVPHEKKTRPPKADGEQKDNGTPKGVLDKGAGKEQPPVPQGKKAEQNLAPQPAEGAPQKGNKAKGEKVDKPPPSKDQKADDKAEAKGKGAKEPPTAQVLIGRVDVRVGLITSVSKHPTVDTFYVTDIDVGTGHIAVVTGVAAFFAPEQLLNKKVCVIVNLESAPCKGVESAGRILCATSSDGKTKEILEAPSAARVGESLTWPGVVNAFDRPVSSKNFSKLAKELTTNANRQAVYRNDFLFTSTAGVITLPTIANGTIA